MLTILLNALLPLQPLTLDEENAVRDAVYRGSPVIARYYEKGNISHDQLGPPVPLCEVFDRKPRNTAKLLVEIGRYANEKDSRKALAYAMALLGDNNNAIVIYEFDTKRYDQLNSGGKETNRQDNVRLTEYLIKMSKRTCLSSHP